MLVNVGVGRCWLMVVNVDDYKLMMDWFMVRHRGWLMVGWWSTGWCNLVVNEWFCRLKDELFKAPEDTAKTIPSETTNHGKWRCECVCWAVLLLFYLDLANLYRLRMKYKYPTGNMNKIWLIDACSCTTCDIRRMIDFYNPPTHNPPWHQPNNPLWSSSLDLDSDLGCPGLSCPS